MAFNKPPRRANLATIVGSSLAVAAAGSLLAFSSLAEQAGLQGLATGRLQPAHPGRSGGGGHAITIPAPATAPPGDPRDDLVELVRRTTRSERVQMVAPPEPVVEFEVAAVPARPAKAEPPRRVDRSDRVAVTEPEVDYEEPAEADGPPYGHAYGHYKNKHEDKGKGPKPGKKHAPKGHSNEQPVYARSANEEGNSKPHKAPKMQKLEKVKKPHPGNGKAKGHSKHGGGNGNGHSKHAHGKGKGKGHSKHGG